MGGDGSDASKFPSSVLGKRYIGWPHERWLDIRELGILAPIMIARMQVCVQKGFDGVEFDNVQDWDNPTGIPITQQESAYYTAWMANQAHKMGLSASWENAPTNVAVLEPYMEALIFESCYSYHFCQKSAPMVQAGKWVEGGIQSGLPRHAFLPDLREVPDGGRVQEARAQVVSHSMRYGKMKPESHGIQRNHIAGSAANLASHQVTRLKPYR